MFHGIEVRPGFGSRLVSRLRDDVPPPLKIAVCRVVRFEIARYVEIVAAESIGRETVQYVSNIYKYYLAYRMAVEQQQLRQKAKGQP